MYSFNRTKRLLHKHQFQFVFENAKKIVTSEYIIFFRENQLEHPRLGLAVSKKAISKAHDRNRIKRTIRESFRISMNDTLLPVDMIVLIKNPVMRLSAAGFRVKLKQTWDQLVKC
ncbi:MAG: ribonuclease P protein component [Legionellaceae bacterium]|nr:ribonuclease P protein component [Legionellaceae bacterium]